MGNPGWKKDNRTLREQDEVGLSEAGSGCGRQARHSQLLAAMGEVDGGGGQGGSSGLLGVGEPDTAVDAAKRRVHPEGEGGCAPAGHPGEGRWRQQGVDCVSERVTDRRAAGERGEKIDEASRVTERDELDNAPERNRNGIFGRSTCEFVEREGAAFSQGSIDPAFQDFEPMKI